MAMAIDWSWISYSLVLKWFFQLVFPAVIVTTRVTIDRPNIPMAMAMGMSGLELLARDVTMTAGNTETHFIRNNQRR